MRPRIFPFGFQVLEMRLEVGADEVALAGDAGDVGAHMVALNRPSRECRRCGP